MFALKSDAVWLEFDLGFQTWVTQEVFGLESVKADLEPGQQLIVDISMQKDYYPTQHAYVRRYYGKVVKWGTEESTKKKSWQRALHRMMP